MKIPNLPEDASPQERFMLMAQAVVNTTPAEIREREAAEEKARLAAGKQKPGRKKAVAASTE